MTIGDWREASGPGLLSAVGHGVSWPGPGLPRFTGESPHAFATREVIAAPTSDFLDTETDADRAQWQIMHATAYAMLADAALLPGVAAFELRYVATPVSGSVQIQWFITAKSRTWHTEVALAAVDSACAKLPRGFTVAAPTTDLAIASEPPPEQVVLELRRDEELTYPTWDFVPTEFYYVLNDEPGDGSGSANFWRSLSAVTSPVSVSLLFQQTVLAPEERDLLAVILSDLALFGNEHTEYDYMMRPTIYPACANASLAHESWARRLERLGRPLLARMAVRGEVSAAVEVATALSSAIAASQSERTARPMTVDAPRSASDERQANSGFDWLEILPWGGHPVWSNWEPQSLRRLPYLFGVSEASSLAVLPVPDSQGVAGMATSRRLSARRQQRGAASTRQGEALGLDPEVSLGRSVHLGNLGNLVGLPLRTLSQHLLTVGSSGYGKTTFVQSLLVQLWRDHEIPFLVFEPFPRSEYRNLLRVPGMEQVQVLTIGNDQIAPLRFNPMDPPSGVACEVHQQAVLAALKAALPLFSPQDTVLVQAIPRAYELAGWDEDTTTDDGLAPPTLRTLMTAYEQVFAEIGYVGEARNIGRGFQTRMEALLTGAKGRALDTVHSHDFAALLARPTIIELRDVIDPEESAVFASFLIDRIRQEAVRRGASAGRLRHVTVIEEAQQILGAGASSNTALGVNDPKAAAVQNLANAVSTLRSFGEGIILSTQRPSEIHPQALANTANRVVLHLEEAEDRDAVLRSFDAGEEVEKIAGRLRPGEALARWPGRDEVDVVLLEPQEWIDTQLAVPDAQVAEHMASHRQATASVLPHRLCTVTVCITGCDRVRRREGSALAKRVAADALTVQATALQQAGDPITPIANLVAAHAGGDMPKAYCAVAHLAVQDIVILDPQRDHRPVVADVVGKAVDAHGH